MATSSPLCRLNGVCRNLIQENGCYLCPLHQARHGKDLRIGHCDTDYLCNTAKLFEKWSEEKKKQFIAFVESKNLDNTEYSILMDNHSLLKEFTDLEKSQIL